jgi:hypothetical protein
VLTETSSLNITKGKLEMKQDKLSGIALIVGSLAMIITMAFHPTGRDLFAGHITLNVVVHSLALASVPVLVFGFLGLSQSLGFDNPTVSFGFVAYSFGSVAAMCAAVINGLVAPSLVREYLSSDESEKQNLLSLFHYGGLLNSAFAKVLIVATSVAILFWSIALIKKSLLANVAAVIGIIFGLLGIVGILSGHLRINVHSFGLFIFGQAAWTVLIGVLMIRSNETKKKKL